MERIEEYRRRRRHHERHNPTRFQLARLVVWLFELVDELLEVLARGGHHHHHDSKGVIVQVQLTESQEVRLHAVEENAEGEPITKDTATCAWTTDRQDIVTLGDVQADDGSGIDSFAVDVVANGGGAFGDTIVTVTVTEPDVDNGDGQDATPGAVYVGTQVVTVAQDEQISQVEIQADAPTEKVA